MEQELLKVINDNEPDYSKLAGGIRLNKSFTFDGKCPTRTTLHNEIDYIRNVLTLKDCNLLIDLFENSGVYAPVTVQGMQEVTDDNIGSQRITAFSPELAQGIYKILMSSPFLIDKHRECHPYSSTDWWQHFHTKFFDFAGVSPMFRFMKYEKGGKHFPHYDAAFFYPASPYRTLKSFVLYLTTNNSGATRFINDHQDHLFTNKRCHDDWSREPELHEIFESVLPVQGDLLIFDHRICHDVSEFVDEDSKRIIIRGDLIYKHTPKW